MPKTRILFDFSSMSKHNIRTGIQRVACRLYEELLVLSNETDANFEIVPVTYQSNAILQGFFQLPFVPINPPPQKSAATYKKSIKIFARPENYSLPIESSDSSPGSKSSIGVNRIATLKLYQASKKVSFGIIKLDTLFLGLIGLYRSTRTLFRYSLILLRQLPLSGNRLNPIKFTHSDQLILADTPWEQAHSFWGELGIRQKENPFQIYTIFYDAIPYFNCDFFHPSTVCRWHNFFTASARLTSCYISISQKSSTDLEIFLKSQALFLGAPRKVLTMGSDLNIDTKYKSLSQRQLNTFGELDNCFLIVGTLEKRKGHEVLLESLTHLNTPASIVVIGRPGYDGNRIGYEIVHHFDYGKRLFLIDDCPDDLLQIAYSRCRAVICPSREEGFGLPLIEAAIKGKKIIANDIPIFREVANDYSLQVEFYANNCPKSLANAMTLISKEKNNVIDSSLSRLKSVPTWRDSAQSVLAILNELR